MALPTNTFATYEAKGNREDLGDIIYRVAQTKTPFVSGVDKVKATATNHEWQTQALASVDTANAVFEGDDATTDAATPTVRLGNICQISDKVARVTGTQQVVRKAGRDDELDYQKLLKGLELKNDMEAILVGTNQVKNAGADATARVTASILTWIKTNNSSGAGGGAAPATADGAALRTDGTQRVFTEALLKTVLAAIADGGGDSSTIMVGSFNKQKFSTFVGRGTPMEDTKSKKIIASVEAYESDFGTLRVQFNPRMRTRDCLILDIEMWAIAYLRNMRSIELAKTGDSERAQIITEYALEARNEKSSGIVGDLTTS